MWSDRGKARTSNKADLDTRMSALRGRSCDHRQRRSEIALSKVEKGERVAWETDGRDCRGVKKELLAG